METMTLRFGPVATLVSEHAVDPRMYRAFALVAPDTWGRADWKEKVIAVLHPDDLTTAGVTLDEVCEAVAFYTATEATVELSETLNGEKVYIVKAPGYRAGPAC